MALPCFLKCTLKLTLVVGTLISAILFLPNLPPHDTDFTSYELPPTKKLEGPLAFNTRLNNAEKLFENILRGPESFAYHNSILYTGVQGGYVVKISGNSITPFVKFGESCAGSLGEPLCGRPLGIRIDSKENLYVADAYYGIFKINITTGKYEKLVDANTAIDGRTPKVVNSVAIGSDGTIYWTDSENFHLDKLIFTGLTDGHGRLIKYDPVSNKNTVLIDRLHFANGIALSLDESQIYFAESMRYRILRYYLKGSKKGKLEVVVDGLPGAPDNINTDKQGNMYVSLITSKDDDELPHVYRQIGQYPILRKFLARTLALTLDFVNIIDGIFPCLNSKADFHSFFQSKTLQAFMYGSKRVTIVKLNKDGVLVDSLYATDGRILGISEIAFVDDYIYLGSPFNNYLARVKVGK